MIKMIGGSYHRMYHGECGNHLSLPLFRETEPSAKDGQDIGPDLMEREFYILHTYNWVLDNGAKVERQLYAISTMSRDEVLLSLF